MPIFVVPSVFYPMKEALDYFNLDMIEVEILAPDKKKPFGKAVSEKKGLKVAVGCKVKDVPSFKAVPRDYFKGECQDYCNLAHHDEYQMREAIGKINDNISASPNKFVSVTNTSLGGWLKQMLACQKSKRKPVYGYEVCLPVGKLMKKSTGRFIAKNEVGYGKMIEMHNYIHEFEPTWIELAEQFPSKDIFFLTGPFDGFLGSSIENEKMDEFFKVFESYDSRIELALTKNVKQVPFNEMISSLIVGLEIPYVVTTPSYFIKKEHDVNLKLVILGGMKKGLRELPKIEDRPWQMTTDCLWNHYSKKDILSWSNDWFKSRDEENWEIELSFGEETKSLIPAGIDESMKMVRQIEDIKMDSSIKLPKLYENDGDVLIEKCQKELRRRALHNDPVYVDRLKTELEVMIEMGVASYFLIMEQIIGFANELGGDWSTGCGRGSAAGSLVAYILGITGIDPIQHGLLFERFLDRERSSKFQASFTE